MKRIKLLLVFLIAPLIFTSCSKGNNSITIAEVTRSIFYAPMYVAINKGYFAEQNLEVDIVTTPGADKTMAALLSKEADIGLMGPEASVYVYNNGQSNYAINFAQLTQRDGSFLLSKDKIENFNFDMLKGKTIIGGRVGGMPEMILEYVLKTKGYEIGRDVAGKDITIRTDIQFDVMAGAFSSGQGDFVALFEPTATQVVNNGKGYIVASLGKESGEIPYTCFSALKSYHQENPKNLEKFSKALYKALRYVYDTDTRIVAESIVSFFPSTDIETVITVINRYKSIQAWPVDITLKEESYNKMLDVVEMAGELTKRVDYKILVTTEFSEKAK